MCKIITVFLSFLFFFIVLWVLEINHQRPAQRDYHSPSWNCLNRLFRHGALNYITHSPHSLHSVDGWLEGAQHNEPANKLN